MTIPHRVSPLLALLLLAGSALSQETGARRPVPIEDLVKRGLNDDTYAAWKEVLLPRPEELLWQAIPWRLTLQEGLEESRKSKKPVLLWAMNGHPFGCT